MKPRQHVWHYSCHSKGIKYTVCQAFLISVLQISQKRLRTIQSKLTLGISIKSRRGKNPNKYKISTKVWSIALKHLNRIPHVKSHYARKKSNRKYFTDSNLTRRKIFELFCAFYQSETKMQLNMKYSTYREWFKKTKFSTRRPRTDVCNLCFRKKRTSLKKSEELDYVLHIKKFEAYKALKSRILEEAKRSNNEILVVEFDYAQNLPMPKIACNDQYYKRLLWLYNFNVHFHNINQSFFYCFTEGLAKKGANSVFSFLFDAITRVHKDFPKLKKIYCFSDSCGGQNKNATGLKSLKWLSKALGVEVEQIFPVKGHSYNICDANFGCYAKKVKGQESIITANDYYEIFRSCKKKNAITVIEDAHLLMKDFEEIKVHFFANPLPVKKTMPAFKIQKYCRILYPPNNNRILVSSQYSAINVYVEYKYSKPTLPKEYKFRQALPDKLLVKPAKVCDVKSLYKYLNEREYQWFDRVFNYYCDTA